MGLGAWQNARARGPRRQRLTHVIVAGWRGRTTVILVVLGLAAVAAPSASAHVFFGPAPTTAPGSGDWVYRAYSFKQAGDCPGGDDADRSDPMNILIWENGAWSRIDDHIADETHWGFTDGSSAQYICAKSTSGGAFNVSANFDNEEDGHIDHHVLTGGRSRAHFRIWASPHTHPDNVDKWSTLTVHHEDSAYATAPDEIDEDWEIWEDHLAGEMNPHHVVYHDVYYHRPAQNFRNYWDNGLVTRIGGLHDGCYNCP
jgi:hypothetical protein